MMRKLFLVAFIVFGAFTPAALAQNGAQTASDVPSQGRAPRELDGVGRLDLRVVDEQGNPVKGVRADLESKRLNGMLCESWNWTDARGVAVLPPIHMGRVTLKLKADGFEKQTVQLDPNKLDEPVRITMLRKK